MRTRRLVVLAWVSACTWPAAAAAQVTIDSMRSPAMSRSIEMLVARLPGRPVTLSDLVSVALRQGFPAQRAAAERRNADGTVMYEGRALDPQLRVASDLGGVSGLSNVADGGQHETSLGLDGALPWGTVLSAEYARSRALSTAGVGNASAPTRFAVNMSQPLLEGFNQRAVPWRAAQVGRAAAELQLRRTKEAITTDLEVQYWLLAEAQSIEAVYARSLELSREILARNEELAKRDLIASVDVLTVRSGVALRESFYAEARQVRYDRSDALVFAVYGANAPAFVNADTLPVLAVDDAARPDTLPDLARSLQVALANRTDLRASRELREAAQWRVRQAHNATLPSLSLEGGWTSVGGGAVRTPTGGTAAGSWRLGLSLGAPLRNRGDRGLSLLATTQLEIADIGVRSQEAQVTREVRAALRAVRLGIVRWQSASQAATLAWEQLIAERRRLELGLGDSFRLLQTEDNAVQAQLAAVRARYDVLRARAQYRLATGTTRGGA